MSQVARPEARRLWCLTCRTPVRMGLVPRCFTNTEPYRLHDNGAELFDTTPHCYKCCGHNHG